MPPAAFRAQRSSLGPCPNTAGFGSRGASSLSVCWLAPAVISPGLERERGALLLANGRCLTTRGRDSLSLFPAGITSVVAWLAVSRNESRRHGDRRDRSVTEMGCLSKGRRPLQFVRSAVGVSRNRHGTPGLVLRRKL